jgi:hypothetical protein
MPHPDEGLIHTWLDGELDAAEAARVETLVASDPEWAAAAAEARGLLAASSRIVGSLDRVPSHVIPKPAAAPRGAGQRWLLRAAAILVLIGGSAVVLNRASTGGGDVTIPLKQPAAPTPAPVVPSAPGPEVKSSIEKKELERPKQMVTLADTTRAAKDRNAPAAESRVALAAQSRTDAAGGAATAAAIGGGAAGGAGANAADVASARRAATPAAAMPAAPAPQQQGALKKAQAFAEEKTTRLRPVCFSQREPRDSAGHLILLDRDALEDSIRLEKFTQHGDTLVAVNGRLRAVRAPCPAP